MRAMPRQEKLFQWTETPFQQSHKISGPINLGNPCYCRGRVRGLDPCLGWPWSGAEGVRKRVHVSHGKLFLLGADDITEKHNIRHTINNPKRFKRQL